MKPPQRHARYKNRPDQRSAHLHLPYWRLSGFYFFYFAGLGAFLPYWSLYLKGEGYDAEQIGVLLALFAATRLITPNLWGWLADVSDRSMRLIRIASLFTALSFLLFERISGYGWMMAATVVAGLFWNAPLPLFEAVTLAYLRDQAHRYSRIRLWGSIGFIVAVLAIGRALDTVLLIECLPLLLFLLFVGMTAFSLTVPERSVRLRHGDGGSWWSLLCKPHIIAFCAVFMLTQAAHGPYYTFFSIYLKDHGFDGAQTGLLWSLGVVAEIVLFLVLHRVLARFSLRRILLVSCLLGVLRWTLIGGWIDSLPVVLGAQLLHAATFGSTHVVAIQLIRKYFSGAHHGKGQSLYSSASYGLGGMIGSYYSGALWDSLGPQVVFALAALASLLATLIVWIWVERPVDPVRRQR
ncbi:MFS transporter [Methylococcus sp. EFPC2]|nr:MFS transporter [Methylococcus sp. EFPC2]